MLTSTMVLIETIHGTDWKQLLLKSIYYYVVKQEKAVMGLNSLAGTKYNSTVTRGENHFKSELNKVKRKIFS